MCPARKIEFLLDKNKNKHMKYVIIKISKLIKYQNIKIIKYRIKYKIR